MGIFSRRPKTQFTSEKADAIAGTVATFYKASLSAVDKDKLTQEDIDVAYAFAFGGIDYLTQAARMRDTNSVAKTTLLFLANHLGIEKEAALKQMHLMFSFSQSPAGLEIMKQGGTALKRFINQDMSAVSVLSDLIAGDYFTSS